MNKKINCNIFIDHILSEVEITFNKKIIAIKNFGSSNPNLPTLIPGFIDLHLHGGGGKDIMEGEDAIATVASLHAKHGTTSFLATTVTAPVEDLKSTFTNIQKFKNINNPKSSKVLGIHLEGPFISKDKLGAQPNFIRDNGLEEIKTLNQISSIKIMTLAPEVSNNQELIKELIQLKIIPQIGHSNGSYEDGISALNNGAKSFTHLFNAMSGFHHREPGIAGAALSEAVYSELIPDLLHVHPAAIKIALKSIPKLYFVTDATSGAGMPDGEYHLGKNKVHKCLGGVRLKDGTLAGSALTMDIAFKNLISIGLSVSEASDRLSKIPAEVINLEDRGLIKENYYSDFIILDPNNHISKIYIEGEEL